MKKPWLKYLQAVREIDSRGESITSQALSVELKISGTDRSSPLHLAAGWLSNLRRWGYVKKMIGIKVMGPRRHLQVYALTDWGKRFRTKKPALRMVANPPRTRGKTEK